LTRHRPVSSTGGCAPTCAPPEEHPLGHAFVIETGGRHAARRLHGEQITAARSLFRHARSGRYFGGLWFKVFSERGPC
jgi:hypothetical protein